MKKFWNKSATGADIFIYGEITDDGWRDTDTTAKSFAEDLNSFGGKPVTVHINSGGGSVFAGLAICNVIKNYSGVVTVQIDGLAASAASLVAMGGDKICAASNSLIMIHNPTVELYGNFEGDELAKLQAALDKIKGAIIQTYSARLKNVDIERLLNEETWFSAQEALACGLIDEITGEVSLAVDDAQKMIFVNSLAVSTKNFNVTKMRRAMEADNLEPIKEKYLASLRTAELGRIKALNNLRGKNAAAIGEVTEKFQGKVGLHTNIGGLRIVDMPVGELVPRIC